MGNAIYILPEKMYPPSVNGGKPEVSSSDNIVGKRFGMWLVVEPAKEKKDRRTTWHCRCDCGVERDLTGKTLIGGHSSGCGCWRHEVRSARFIDLSGKRFGSWTVVSFAGLNDNRQSVYSCRCDCGTERIVVSQALREGLTKSCGCEKAKAIAEAMVVHGESRRRDRSPELRAWESMWSRCSPNNNGMKALYSDRGITICDRWSKYDNFLADMGKIPHPGWTLDRENNNKGYYKSNCRWADCQTQSQNRRQNQRNRRIAA